MIEDVIPSIGVYRGIHLHAFQPADRIASVVRPAIDRVNGMTSPDALSAYLRDPHHPPEARLLAAARLEALWSLAAESREVRPKISLEAIHAETAGLDSLGWADPANYGSLLDPTEKRPRRDPACGADLEEAQAQLR